MKYYVKHDQIAMISMGIPKSVTKFASCPPPPSALHSTPCFLCAVQGPRGAHACHNISLRRCVIVVDMATLNAAFYWVHSRCSGHFPPCLIATLHIQTYWKRIVSADVSTCPTIYNQSSQANVVTCKIRRKSDKTQAASRCDNVMQTANTQTWSNHVSRHSSAPIRG